MVTGGLIMKGKKILGIGLLSALMICTYLQFDMTAQANNHTDTTFSFSYIADGTDAAVAPRSKTDNTASYVKSNKGIIGFTSFVAGTSNAGNYSAIAPNACSSRVYVPSGSYRYISNNVYGRYAYAYLVQSVSQDNRAHRLAGRWSPDNISGRY
jgi:hypothetical protein